MRMYFREKERNVCMYVCVYVCAHLCFSLIATFPHCRAEPKLELTYTDVLPLAEYFVFIDKHFEVKRELAVCECICVCV